MRRSHVVYSAQDVYGRHSVTVHVQSSAPVPRPGDRSNLASASSEHVASELRQLVGRFLLASAIYASDDSYTCRPCFSRIEKILKLRKTTEDIAQEVMVNLKHTEYLYGRQRCRTRRYAQVRELRVDDGGSRCIGKRLQRAARRTCTFHTSVRHYKDSLAVNTCSCNLIGLPTFRQRTQKPGKSDQTLSPPRLHNSSDAEVRVWV